MRMIGIIGSFICLVFILLLTACQDVQKFKDKVVTETQKTMHFTAEPDRPSVTMEQLIDSGNLDRFVFNNEVYEMETEVSDKEVGRALGSVGQIYYVDQYGKRWTKQELKESYVYANPAHIREKKPLQYGIVYDATKKGNDDHSVVIRFNHKYIKALPVSAD